MGKVYYDMGFLSSAKVEECFATELIGEYVGQTGPKTQKLVEKGLGKVLFIDEAYRLSDGMFAKEAMDELVDCLTKPKFAGKLVIILAGYDEHINRLMNMNPGLRSRFPETITFENLTPDACIALLKQELQRKKPHLDCTCVEMPDNRFYQKLLDYFGSLSKTANWANARDIQTISRAIFQIVISTADGTSSPLMLAEEVVLSQVELMLQERRNCAKNMKKEIISISPALEPARKAATLGGRHSTMRTQKNQLMTVSKELSTSPTMQSRPDELVSKRDQGVDDATWQQLQYDTRMMVEREEDFKKLCEREEAVRNALSELQEYQKRKALETQRKVELMKEQEIEQQAIEEARRVLDEERLQLERQRRATEEQLAKLERQRKEEENEREQEALAQQKLRCMGICIAGYPWTKQLEGFRCEGGSHYISNAELGM